MSPLFSNLALLSAAPAESCTVTHQLPEGAKQVDTFSPAGRWLSATESSSRLQVETTLRYDSQGRVSEVLRRESLINAFLVTWTLTRPAS